MPLFYTENGFMKAVAKGDIELIGKYFAHGGKEKWLALTMPNWGTPLHVAAENGQVAAAKHLIAAGADPNKNDEHGRPPIAGAFHKRNATVVQALIDAGADVNASSPEGTLLATAVAFSFDAGMKVLLKNKVDLNRSEPFREAIRRNYRDAIVELLQAGAAPDKELAKEIFFYAAQYGYVNVMREMLDRGVDINAQNEDGWTALHHAAARSQKASVDFLLEQKARYDIKNNDGRTAGALAEYYGNSQIVHKIKALEEEVAAKNATPLNATAKYMPDNSAETWVMMGEKQIAHVGLYPAVGRRLTHIFNFESRERIIISENLKTGAESVTQPEKFDTLEQPHLEKALAAFRERGGKAEDAAVFGSSLSKKSLPGPGGQ